MLTEASKYILKANEKPHETAGRVVWDVTKLSFLACSSDYPLVCWGYPTCEYPAVEVGEGEQDGVCVCMPRIYICSPKRELYKSQAPALTRKRIDVVIRVELTEFP